MNLKWLYNRLTAMSLAEVAWRVLEQGKRRYARYQLQGAARFRDHSTVVPCLPGFADTFDANMTAEDRQVIGEAAAQILAGRFSALGVVWPEREQANLYPRSIWSTDPVTGQHWPEHDYCFSIPYRHRLEIGDVKYVWEFGRLQFLQVLAAEYRLSEDGRVLAAIEDAILSWCAANPPFRGVHYAEILNVAMRAISLLVATSLCADALSGQTVLALRRALRAHAVWLSLFPSRFSSANNHLVAELAAEYLIALAMGGKEFTHQREHAWETLMREVELQILPDGVNAEQSPAYGAFTAEFVLLACLVAREEGRSIPDAVIDRLRLYAQQIFLLADGHGQIANLCDNDEGRVLTLCQHEPLYAFSVASAICGFFGIPAQTATAAPATLRMALFGRSSLEGVPQDGLHVFRNGGISVVRGAVGASRYLLTFDHAPLGYLSIAAHGHADALSITLTLDDAPLLVDPGTYLYHSGGAWRDWFRSTPAHNTLNIEGRDQSTMSGAFNWSSKATARLEAAAAGPAWRVAASHDGYEKSCGVRHFREVAACADGIAIVDRIEGAGTRQAEIVFQTDPAVSAERNGVEVRLCRDGIAVAELVFGSPGEISIVSGGERGGGGGWVSDKFGSKVPAPRICWRGTVPPEGMETRIILAPGAAPSLLHPIQEGFSA